MPEPVRWSASPPSGALRIGLLGAARIADDAVISPAHQLGHRLVAVAARDAGRAAHFAERHGIQRAHSRYDAVLEDQEVEAVYIALPNGWHGYWTRRALAAGKHVLCEKPSAANAAEAEQTRDAAKASGLVFMEAMHYLYHPMWGRVRDLVVSGSLGTIVGVRMPMAMPAPLAADPRWSWELAGGALMDLGCYSLSALTDLGSVLGGDPTLFSSVVTGSEQDPRIDDHAEVVLQYPTGAQGRAGATFGVAVRDFSLSVTGSEATLSVPSMMLTHLDDRLYVSADQHSWSEHLGERSTYSFQLEAFAAAIREQRPVMSGVDFSVRTMSMIDASYRLAGFPVRVPAAP